MGLFSRNKQARETASGTRIIPDELLSLIPRVGIAVFEGGPPYPDVSEFYLPGFLAAGAPTDPAGIHAFSLQLVSELSDASLGSGDWTSAGAFHIAKDFVPSEFHSDPIFVEVMDNALTFLAAKGISARAIPNFAVTRFIEIRDGQA